MTEPLSMDQAFIKKLTDIVLANLANENLSVEKLAKEAGLTHVALYRKLRSIKHQYVTHFIREVRLQRAMEMLLHNEGTVTEIAFRVGFGSPAYFNKCFHEYYGSTPGEIRRKTAPEEINVHESDSEAKGVSNESLIGVKKTPVTRMKVNRKMIILLSTAFIVVFAVVLFLLNIYPNWEEDLSIIVLPFKNISEDPENQHIANGVMEDILNNLYKISELRVISRTTAEHFQGSNLTTGEIARKVNARNVLEGSVRRYGDRIKISIQLIDAYRDRHLWSEVYDQEFTSIFDMQNDIAGKVADELSITLSNKEIELIKKVQTTNSEAYNLYLYGRFFINKTTEEGFRKSVEYFEKAVAADTSYALAYAGMADAYFLMSWWNKGYPTQEGYAKAKEYASKSLELDKNLAEAHTVMGGLLTYYEWKWEDARKELQLALKLNPNISTGHSYYSDLLDILRQNEEAREQINIAMNLDPFFPVLRAVSGVYYYHEGKFKESLAEYKKACELDPELDVNWGLYTNYLKLDDDNNAIAELERTQQTDNIFVEDPNYLSDLYRKSGMDGIKNWLIGMELKKSKPSPLNLAYRYLESGKKEEALNWLEKALAEKEPRLPRINNNPDFDNLRSEPRFLAIIDKMGLSDYK